MKRTKQTSKKPKSTAYLVAAVLIVAALVGSSLFVLQKIRSKPKTTTSNETPGAKQVTNSGTTTTTNSPIPDTPSTTESKISAPTASQATNPQPAFAVSAVTLHNPEIVYNHDRLGNAYKACKVEADITATSGGEATYYWDTYHPEYYTPSYRTDAQKVVFEGKGTKTVKLDTYTSDDNRRFTILITQPNSVSKVTATQVWCPKS